MPNWKLGTFIREEIVNNAKQLTQRRVDHATANFPMTADEIQAGIIKSDHLTTLADLQKDGVAGLPMEVGAFLYLSPDYIFDLEREMVLHLDFKKHLFVSKPARWWGTMWSNSAKDCARLDTGVLSGAHREALAVWANRVVKEKRVKKVIDRTVSEVVEKCATMGHLLSWSPMLTTLVTDTTWKLRFQHPPARMKAYGPAPELLEQHARHLKVAEVTLLGAQMMSAYEFPEDEVRAHVTVWKSLPNDAPGT